MLAKEISVLVKFRSLHPVLSPDVNCGCFVPAHMTDGLEPLVGNHIDYGFCCGGIHRLLGNFNSTKKEIR